ncbi:hypothetical protein ABK040_016594 [Willaertia magna]
MFDWLRFIWCLIVTFLLKPKHSIFVTEEEVKKKKKVTELPEVEKAKLNLLPTYRLITHYYVTPFDIDWNFHMNHTQFLTALEFARVSYIFVTGMWNNMNKFGLVPMVMGISFQFRRSVHLFKRIRVETQLISIDEHFLYFEQSCYQGNNFLGRGIVRVGVCYKNKAIANKNKEKDNTTKNSGALLATENYAKKLLLGDHDDKKKNGEENNDLKNLENLYVERQVEETRKLLSSNVKDEHFLPTMVNLMKKWERVKSFVEHDLTLKETM